MGQWLCRHGLCSCAPRARLPCYPNWSSNHGNGCWGLHWAQDTGTGGCWAHAGGARVSSPRVGRCVFVCCLCVCSICVYTLVSCMLPVLTGCVCTRGCLCAIMPHQLSLSDAESKDGSSSQGRGENWVLGRGGWACTPPTHSSGGGYSAPST